MIAKHINSMNSKIEELSEIIKLDIEDIKFANHDSIQNRVERKNELINILTTDKSKLNSLIIEAMNRGEDVNIYRALVDNLESNLYSLQKLNRDFATILMPIKQLYEELIEKSFGNNDGLVQVKA